MIKGLIKVNPCIAPPPFTRKFRGLWEKGFLADERSILKLPTKEELIGSIYGSTLRRVNPHSVR